MKTTKLLERTVKEAVKKRLKVLGAYQFWPVQTGLGSRTLDVLGVYQGRGFGIECKRPGKKPTAIQAYTIEQIRAAGGVVYVVDTPEGANDIFAQSGPTK
jgi:hypothetical protein